MTIPRETAQKLIRLAVDPGAAENERIVAAVKAVGVINEHGLLDSPLESVGDLLRSAEGKGAARAASKLYEVLTDPDIAAALKGISGKVREASAARKRRR